MSFLPENYSVPDDSNYMKLEKGANKLRVLGSAIVGNEYWKTVDGARKPIRKHMGESIPVSELEFNTKFNKPEDIKHFWAFPVWNYKAQKVQILEITQKTIMSAFTAYVENEDWGDPKAYDLTISKEGDGLDTEYTVIASPHKKLAPEIAEAYKQTPINLDALFLGEDPFSQDLADAAEEALK